MSRPRHERGEEEEGIEACGIEASRRGLVRGLLAVIAVACGWIGCSGNQGTAAMDARQLFNDPKVAELADAAGKGDADRVAAIVGRGVDPNATGQDGLTPLMFALTKRNKEGMRALLKAKADPNQPTVQGTSAMSLAAGADDIEFLKILLDGGGDPNTRAAGEPILFIAFAQRRFDAIDLLLSRGANVNAVNMQGETLMLRAANINQFEFVHKLLMLTANHAIASKSGGTVALRVQENKVAAGSEAAAWRDRVKSVLIERGVKFPVPRPWEKKEEKGGG